MSGHPIRYYRSGDRHFTTRSLYRRQSLLGTAQRRDLFLTVLENVRGWYQFVVEKLNYIHDNPVRRGYSSPQNCGVGAVTGLMF